MNKNTYKILAIIVLCLFSSSCSKMLDEKPFDFTQPAELGDSKAAADQLTTGVYNELTAMFLYSQFPRCLDADNDYISGPDWAMSATGSGNFQGDDTTDALWTDSYLLIYRAITARDMISKMTSLTDAQKNNYIGEMNFLQAWGYFLLVRAYGDIPLWDKTVSEGADFNQPRQPIATVYAKIIDLLTKSIDAKTGMYKNTDAGFTPGHVSAGAGATLLTKVYCTMASGAMAAGTQVNVRGGVPFIQVNGANVLTSPVNKTFTKAQVAGYESFSPTTYYTKARDLAKAVMAGSYGTYGLLPAETLWSQSNHNQVEQIFSLQAKNGDVQYGNPMGVWWYGTYNSLGQIVSGQWMGERDHWYKLFESQDKRVTIGVKHRWQYVWDAAWNGADFYPNTEEYQHKAFGYTDANGVVHPPVAPYNDGLNYQFGAGSMAYLMKYGNITDPTQAHTDFYYPFLRYADVILLFAEASNEVDGPNAAALAALNLVRTRSSATPKTLTGVGGLSSKLLFRSAVLEERAMEFAGEGDRRWDLIRWGIYLPVMNSIGGLDENNVTKARSEKHLLYPIPAVEMNTNTAIKENNPGWN